MNFLYKATFIISTFILVSVFHSCKKDDSSTSTSTSSSQGEFYEIIIDGQKFRTDFPKGVEDYSGFDNQNLCDSKIGYFQQIAGGGTDLNARFYIDMGLMHYKYNADMSAVKTGNYSLKNTHPISGNYCNLILYLTLNDKLESTYKTSLSSGFVHTVTSINKVREEATQTIYMVAGNFSADFKNNSNVTIKVTGSYQKMIHVTK